LHQVQSGISAITKGGAATQQTNQSTDGTNQTRRDGSEHQKWDGSDRIVPDLQATTQNTGTFWGLTAPEMKLRRWLLTGLVGMIVTSPAGAWEQDDRSNYNNKMALLGVLPEGAKQRAQENGDIETICLLLSVGTDVTANYVNSAPNNQQINQRLVAMNRDRNMCFSMLKKTALKP
jgi:hypothetical protein